MTNSRLTQRVLVDSNIVIDVLRNRTPAADVLDARLQAGDALAVSTLTRYEVLGGARPDELPAVTELLGIFDAIPVDQRISDRAAEHARQYRRSHRSIDALDYLIAATAELHANGLLTLNVKHFPMIADLRAPY